MDDSQKIRMIANAIQELEETNEWNQDYFHFFKTVKKIVEVIQMDEAGKRKVEAIIERTIETLENQCDWKGIQIFEDEIAEIADEIRYQLTGERAL